MKQRVVLFKMLLGPTSRYSDLIGLRYSLGIGILLNLSSDSDMQVKVENHYHRGWAVQHITQMNTGF